MPNRREYIASVGGAAFLSGCSTEQEERTPNETSTSDNGDQPTNDTADESDIDLIFDTAEWFEEGFVAEFIVTNRDSIAVQSLEIIVDWYDDDGNFIDWDSKSVPALKPNSSWYLHVEKSGEVPADSFEVTARFIGRKQSIPDNLEIRSTTVENPETLSGIISNMRDSEIGVLLVATVYDNDWLTHVGRVSQSRIPPETDWQFRVPIQSVDADFSPPGSDIALFISQL
ncbi:hypothetical protein J2751_003189 [Halorubrum alkaliphilum]|uniref:Uncharacterized protein n=1 Tax=Halorubrum alkaliphilum TaxID=261290 RepID=A0A8T4GKA7_9EURY|nr:FxLYD domain-containing protein [Halorubrum alkaliphilum]MBP1924137.1 hypothetical protein [Halorubrum alkaliphilum]